MPQGTEEGLATSVLSTDEGAGTYSDLVYDKPQSVELERRFLQADPKPDPACGRFDVECESFLIAGGGQTGSDPRTGRGRTRKTNGGNGTGVLRRWRESDGWGGSVCSAGNLHSGLGDGGWFWTVVETAQVGAFLGVASTQHLMVTCMDPTSQMPVGQLVGSNERSR